MKRQVRARTEPLKRGIDSHKGQNGLVLVIGGSDDYVGAPALAGLSALRAGCDIVNIAAPEKVAWAINALSPDLITTKLKGISVSAAHASSLASKSRKFDAVLFGNGLGNMSRQAVNSIIRSITAKGVPMVIDADAVKVADIRNLKNTVLTPHAEEFRLFLAANRRTFLLNELDDRKLSDEKKIQLIQQDLDDLFCQGNVLLLKGVRDLIIAKNRSLIVKGGNPGMTVGGTGDVLAGLCAGYLAQTAEQFMSAGLASTNCKKIGDGLLKRSNFGFGFIASDFLREIRKLKRVAVS